MAEVLFINPPSPAHLERLWNRYREAHEIAKSDAATLEDGLEAGRRYKAFMEACVDWEGEF